MAKLRQNDKGLALEWGAKIGVILGSSMGISIALSVIDKLPISLVDGGILDTFATLAGMCTATWGCAFAGGLACGYGLDRLVNLQNSAERRVNKLLGKKWNVSVSPDQVLAHRENQQNFIRIGADRNDIRRSWIQRAPLDNPRCADAITDFPALPARQQYAIQEIARAADAPRPFARFRNWFRKSPLSPAPEPDFSFETARQAERKDYPAGIPARKNYLPGPRKGSPAV